MLLKKRPWEFTNFVHKNSPFISTRILPKGFFNKEATDMTQSIIILALLNQFVYDYRWNDTYVIQEKTALILPLKIHPTNVILWKFPLKFAHFEKKVSTKILHAVILGEKFNLESVCTVPFVMMMPLNVDLLIKDSIKHGISVQSWSPSIKCEKSFYTTITIK